MGTENIKPSLFLRYPFLIAAPAIVAISNRYPTKKETPALFMRNGAFYSIISNRFVKG
jgi:hypothetical protein